MADVIAKLKADTTQWDSGLNKAKQTLQKFSEQGLSCDNVAKGLIGTFGKYVTVVGALKGAYDGINKAIETNEAAHDTLQRALYASQNATDAFFTSISTGNFNAFTDGLQGVIDKAVEAYNAIDELGSYLSRFNPNAAALRAQITTLQQEAKALKAAGDIAGANAKMAQARGITKQLAANTTQAGKLQVNAGFKDLQSLMKDAGGKPVNNAGIAWYADPKNWDKVNAKAKEYVRLQKQIKDYDKAKNGGRLQGETAEGYQVRLGALASASIAAKKKLNSDLSLTNAYTFQNLRDDNESDAGRRFNAALTNIYGDKLAAAQNASLQASLDRQSALINKKSSSGNKSNIKTKATTETVAPGSELIDEDYLDIITVHLENKAEEWGTTVATTFKESLSEGMSNLGDAIDLSSIDSTFEESLNAEKLKIYNNQVKKTQQAWNYASEAISNAGAALSSTGDQGMNVAGIIMQAVANIALGFAQADAHSGAEGNVWAWIAASVAGIATMVSTIAAVKSATAGSYADGGVIGGNSYSGDKLYARVNSGETILNQQQAQTALDMMNPSPVATGGSSHPYVSGEQIFMGMNNYGKRTGRGELVWSRG